MSSSLLPQPNYSHPIELSLIYLNQVFLVEAATGQPFVASDYKENTENSNTSSVFVPSRMSENLTGNLTGPSHSQSNQRGRDPRRARLVYQSYHGFLPWVQPISYHLTNSTFPLMLFTYTPSQFSLNRPFPPPGPSSDA